MQRAAALALALFGSLGAAGRVGRSSAAGDEHPVEKVIKLLRDLDSQAITASQNEETEYGKFVQWCKTSKRTLEKAIEKEKDEIESLTDKVASLKEEERTMSQDIDFLGNQIMKYQAGTTKDEKAREKERGLWEDADKDLEDTIDAINQAITALETEQSKSKSLVQRPALARVTKLLQLPMLLAELTDAQHALLTQATSGRDGTASSPAPAPYASREDILAAGNAQAHQKKYNFKSGNVIELLKELKRKFEDDRVEATKAETNAQNAYDLTEDARSKAIATAQSAKQEKQSALGEVQGDLSGAQSDLRGYKDDLRADKGSLEATQESCSLKASEYEERTELREKEKEAINKAIEILIKVSGVRTEQPENPIPPPSPLDAQSSGSGSGGQNLLQMRGPTDDPRQVVAARSRAINLLRQTAKRSHDQALAEFAEQVASMSTGPFDQVQTMIQKMIFRLMAEQKDEDEHKAWCDLEIEKTNLANASKSEKIELLEVKIRADQAKVVVLGGEIDDANTMVADLESHTQEATEIRQAGSAENKAAVQDAKDAQAAIAQATAVLEAYYKESGMMPKQSWELLQSGSGEPVTVPDEPATWSNSYTGIADPNNQPDGIISMLKEISADFAKLEADTLASEAMDKKAYDEEMMRSDIEKSKRKKEAEMKADEKKRLINKVKDYQESLRHTENELHAVEQYSKDLAPACLDGTSTYEDRKSSRELEIEALKEAQVILEDAFKGGGAPAPAPAASFLAPARPH